MSAVRLLSRSAYVPITSRQIATSSILPRRPLSRPTQAPTSVLHLLRFNSNVSSTDIITAGVNPPASTLPPPLDLPESKPSDGAVSKLWGASKAYLSFFKNGIKAVWTNYKAAKPINARIKSGDGTLTFLVESNALSRAEFQQIMRSRHDIARLPIFGLIFLICGEMSVFVLPFVTGLVPWTCRIPAQMRKERRQRDEKAELSWNVLEAKGLGKRERWEARNKIWKELTPEEAQHVVTVRSCKPLLPLTFTKKWKAMRAAEYCQLDDVLLKRGGGVQAIDSVEEVARAVEERGWSVQNLNEEQLRQKLELWMKIKEVEPEVRPGWWLVKESEWREHLNREKLSEITEKSNYGAVRRK